MRPIKTLKEIFASKVEFMAEKRFEVKCLTKIWDYRNGFRNFCIKHKIYGRGAMFCLDVWPIDTD